MNTKHNRSTGPGWGRILARATVAAGLLLGGCQSAAPTAPPSPDSAPVAPQAPTPLVIRTNEYSFEAPAEIAGGWVNLDFSFTLPSEIKAGVQTWKIVDAGEQPHEMNLIKLADGKTMEDVAHWMHAPEGAPPFANVGGMQGIDPNEAAYLHLDLEPRDYVAICHIPDPASGKPHDALGMVLPFTVKS